MPAGNPAAYLSGMGGNPFGGGAQGIADILPLLIRLQAMQGQAGGQPDMGPAGPQSMNGGGLKSGPSMEVQMQPPGGPPQSMHGNPVSQPGMGGPPPVQRGQAPVWMQPSTQNLPWVQNGQMQAPAYAGGLAQRLAQQRQGRMGRPGAPPSGSGGTTPTGPPRGTVIPRPRNPQGPRPPGGPRDEGSPPFYPGPTQKPRGGGSPPFYPGGNAQSLKGSRR